MKFVALALFVAGLAMVSRARKRGVDGIPLGVAGVGCVFVSLVIFFTLLFAMAL